MLKLRLLTGPRAGRQLRISDTKPVSIGRRKGRLRLHDSRVSKNHAEIYFANDMWVLRDLGSANGTYINRKKVAGLVELESGDLVQMGRVLFKIVRCDGIGMDTQPALPDEWLGDDALGIGTAEAPAEEPAGDLDLEALFGGSESVDANDDSGIFAAADEPAVDADTDADELPSAGVLEQDEQVSEPIEAAFEEPVDDDDSFFADLGESTDTSGGADVAVSQALDDDNDAPVAEKLGDEGDPFVLEDADAAADAGDPAEALDPFLSGDEQEDPEGTGDLISLEDESGMGPRNSGTTLLTAVPHDDLINDESESSGPAIMDAEGEPGAKASEATEVEEDANDDDGLSPPLVGLHLDQAPPQQPETIGEEPAEPDTGAGASIDDDELGLQLDEPADEATVADLLVDEAPDDQPAAFEKVDDPEETPIDALAADEPIAEIDESAASSEDGVDAALGELDNSDESDDLTEELLAALDDDDATSDPLSVGDAQDSLAEEPGVTDEIADEPEPSASEASEEDPPEGAPVFDIDAAFDALSEGLDDSFEVPAIGADEVESQPADPAAADPLAGSQLDVGYIKDALSKLNEEQAESTDGLSDTSPKAAASPMDGGYIQSPPPGLNPSSLNPPEEPSKAYRPPGSAGRWFFTLLLFLTIGGAGVWYVSEHYDIQITGRDDAGPATANASAPVVPGPADEAGSELPAAENVSTGAEPPPADEVFETRPSGPNPFASGSVVLGQEALDGITRGTSASPEPSPTLPPGATDAPGRADRVSSDPTPQPPRIEPQPVVIP
ncbi:MAG: FHA domain-containing protein, partial [Phycisphaeraceae bacterium]|nr:FHA domain-containing protein [Phycisphaeraceae bacterium]